MPMLNRQCGPSCAQGELNRTVCISLCLEPHCFEAADSDEGSRNLRKLAENKGIAFAVSVDKQSKDSSDSDLQPTPKKSLTFCVEGNISIGNTTFLRRIANETLELHDLVEIVPELINNWRDVGLDHFDMLFMLSHKTFDEAYLAQLRPPKTPISRFCFDIISFVSTAIELVLPVSLVVT
ncbi:unnamed protein product [Camellia sinensis]